MLKQIIAAMTRQPATAPQPVSAAKAISPAPTPALSFELSTAELVDLCLVASSLGIGYKAALSKLIVDAKANLATSAGNATTRLIAKLYGAKK